MTYFTKLNCKLKKQKLKWTHRISAGNPFYTPILRIVSYKQSKSNTQSHQEFVNLHYVPLAKSYIDQVHIDIKDEIGRSVPFVGGKTLVKLHFKRIKS